MKRVYLSKKEGEALFWVLDHPGAEMSEYPDTMGLVELVQKGVAVFGRSGNGRTIVTLTDLGMNTAMAYRGSRCGKGV